MSHTGQGAELITATQAGHLIRRSGRTVIRAAEAGRLAFAQKLPGPNGAYLFRREDVEALARELGIAS